MNRKECHICDVTFKTKAYLSKHLKVKHVTPTPADTSSEKQKARTEGCRPREPAETNQSSVNQTRVGAQDTSKTVPDSVQRTGCMHTPYNVRQCDVTKRDIGRLISRQCASLVTDLFMYLLIISQKLQKL